MDQKPVPAELRRQSLIALRRALIMLLDALEDYLGIPRSIVKSKEPMRK